MTNIHTTRSKINTLYKFVANWKFDARESLITPQKQNIPVIISIYKDASICAQDGGKVGGIRHPTIPQMINCTLSRLQRC